MFKPTYHVRTDGDDYVIRVTPHKVWNLPPREITLTKDQYARYLKWQARAYLIQDCLPELTDGEREILVSGMDQKKWDETFREEEE